MALLPWIRAETTPIMTDGMFKGIISRRFRMIAIIPKIQAAWILELQQGIVLYDQSLTG